MQKRWMTDGLMGVLFLALLSFPFLPPLWHEVLGVVVVLAVAAHLHWNGNYVKALSRGRWTAERVVNALVNGLLFASLAAAVISGIIISHHLFRGIIPMAVRQTIGMHTLHTWAPWVLLVLIGLHLGMHGKPMWMRLMRALSVNTRSTAYHIGSTALELAVIFLGVFCFITDSMPDRLTMHHVFATDALMLGGPLYVLSLLFRVGLFAILGDKLEKVLKRR